MKEQNPESKGKRREEEIENVLEQYKQTYRELQNGINQIKEELDNLEDSGEADEHPVKHQKAKDKMEEIDEQLEKLEEAMDKSVKERD